MIVHNLTCIISVNYNNVHVPGLSVYITVYIRLMVGVLVLLVLQLK